jgi:hypothetical protein
LAVTGSACLFDFAEVVAHHISDLSYCLGIAALHESLSNLDDHSMVDQRFCNVVVVADSSTWRFGVTPNSVDAAVVNSRAWAG